MWKPVKLILNNFRSFKYQEYNFETGAFLIQGINKTDDSAKSNGSGKSSLQLALNFVLDLPMFITSDSDLINKDSDNSVISLLLKNEVSDSKLFIERSIYLKKSSKLRIELNDKDQSNRFATVPEGNKLISELIGISKEDLINYFIISKEKFVSFFGSSDTKVKELIGRFSNFNLIDGIEKTVESDVSDVNMQVVTLTSEVDRLIGKLEVINEQKDKEQNKDFEVERQRIVENFELKIKFCNQSIEGEQSKIKEIENDKELKKNRVVKFKDELLTLKSELNKLGKVSYDDEIKKLDVEKQEKLKERQKLNIDISELNENLKEFIKFRTEIENSIAGSIQCPKCLHEFIPNEEIDIEEAKTTLPNVLEELKNLDTLIGYLRNNINGIDDVINGINDKVKVFQKNIDVFNAKKRELSNSINSKEIEINKANSDIENCDVKTETCIRNIDSYKEEIVNLNKSIDDTKNRKFEVKNDDFDTQIEELVNLIEDKNNEITILKEEIADKSQWINRFKRFRNYLANEFLEIIQGYINLYLQKMNTNLSVQLEGYKTNKDGTVREKITPIIMRNGEVEGSGNYRKYSGGERGKIDFAAIMALQTLINNSSPNGGMDLIFVDEVLDSIDSVGLENLVSSVDNIGKTVLVTSHVTHEKVHPHILTIEKVNGISKII